MRNRLGAVGLVSLLLTLLPGPHAAAPTAKPVLEPGPRIMVVGDSVAHQFDGDYTWRYRLAKEFQRQQAAANFVGPFRWGYGDANNYLGTDWDSDHDAQGATVIKNFMDLEPVPGAPEWGRYNIVDTMERYSPDVLVSVMANNDVNNALAGTRYGVPSIREGLRVYGRAWAAPRVQRLVDDVLADYSAFLASARSVRPDVKVVIAQVTSQLIPPWVRDRVNAAFAERLVSTATSPVVIAPTDSPRWARPGYTVDGIHTTPTGDLLIAQRIAAGIHRLPGTPLPGAPRIPQIRIPWSPEILPRISVVDRRLVLDWGLTARANTVLAMRVRVIDLRTGKQTTTPFARGSDWTSERLAPGTYHVQVQGRRKQMIATWSPRYVVRVR